MKKILNVHFQRILSLFVLCVLCVAMFMGGQMTAPVAYADTAIGDVQMDSSNVMDDLQNSTIDGVPFDITDYAFDENQPTQVFMLAEYCYSFYKNLRGNFGLYLYVWNPQGLSFNLTSTQNVLEMSYGGEDGTESGYNWYPLFYLNRCEITNYEGLFYKFEVYLTGEQKTTMLDTLNSSERTYHISGIELLLAGETSVHDEEVNQLYTYSGYSAGYGSNPDADGTLSYERTNGQVFVIEDDDLHQTFYRPVGTISGTYFSQDTLHTVYFSIPNEMVEKFGRLALIRVRWLEALLNPVLITGNEDIFNALQSYIGTEMGAYEESGFEYGLLGGYKEETTTMGGFTFVDRTAEVAYNPWYDYLNSVEKEVNRLCLAFFSGNETDSADSYTVGGEGLLDKMLEYSRNDTDLVLDKYSRELFSSVADDYTVVDVPAEKEYSLTSEKVSQTFWEKLFGTSHTEFSDTFDGIQAIYPVSEKDFGKTKEQTCQNLYIDVNDYGEFLSVYESAKEAKETVYLFRFDQSKYNAWEVTQGKWERKTMWVPNQGAGGGTWQSVPRLSDTDTNAYFAEETVYLGLDLIHMEWDDGGKRVIIPIVSSPIDVAADLTDPVYTTSDATAPAWWAYVILVVGEVLILWLLQILLHKLCGLPTWVMIILVAVTVVLDIFFIQTWALSLTKLLEPYLGWLPFS